MSWVGIHKERILALNRNGQHYSPSESQTAGCIMDCSDGYAYIEVGTVKRVLPPRRFTKVLSLAIDGSYLANYLKKVSTLDCLHLSLWRSLTHILRFGPTKRPRRLPIVTLALPASAKLTLQILSKPNAHILFFLRCPQTLANV